MTSIKDFATPSQLRYLEAVQEHGSQREAARALGVSQSTVSESLAKLRLKAAQKGHAPEADLDYHVPDGYKVKAVSTLYDPDGKVKLQWLKTAEDRERLEEFRAALVAGMVEDLPKAEPVLDQPAEFHENIMTAYPIGDHHLGMLSWGEETGEDYDMYIGEELLQKAMAHLVATSPPSHTALIAVLGDFFHYDSVQAITPTSRNMLDTDTRYQKMVRMGIKLIRWVVDRALGRHKLVHIIVEIGNHDLATSAILMEAMKVFYESDPRVSVDTGPGHFHYFRFGKCLIGTHHGHGPKMDKLPLIMATDQPEAWGATEFRYWWTGHIHQDTVKDFSGCRVESFRVLPPADAWAHNSGYRPMQDMKAIVLHKDFGEVARHVVNPKMLK